MFIIDSCFDVTLIGLQMRFLYVNCEVACPNCQAGKLRRAVYK